MKHSNNTLDFYSALTILLIGLRLANIINWKWYWVIAPIWIQLVVMLIVYIIFITVDKIKRR